jgi:hypothetical protein
MLQVPRAADPLDAKTVETDNAEIDPITEHMAH